MKMKKIILALTIFLLISSCNNYSTMFDPTYYGDGFKGITFTSEIDPTPLKVDPTDWCYSDSNSLPKVGTDSVDTDIIAPSGFSFGAAYPNPTTLHSSINIRFTIPETTFVHISVINKDYNVVADLINDQLIPGTHLLTFDTKNIGSGVFRVIFESDKFYCKGDIWIKGSE